MKLVQGVGINDISICGAATYKDDSGRKVSLPDYEVWKAMILRCFSNNEKRRRPACVSSTCSEEWKSRYNFQQWYFSQGVYLANDGSKLQLDKDIISYGNTTYSADLCCLVPHYLNQNIRDSSRAETPWVRYEHKAPPRNPLKKPWRSSVFNQGEHTELGMFSKKGAAHKAAQLCKASIISDVLIPRYREETCYRADVEEALYGRVLLLRSDANLGKITRLQ